MFVITHARQSLLTVVITGVEAMCWGGLRAQAACLTRMMMTMPAVRSRLAYTSAQRCVAHELSDFEFEVYSITEIHEK